MSSRRQKKSAALAQLRQRRQMGSSLDDFEIKEEEDVFEMVEEDEYNNLVNARRQREDFIVDDDGLGYYDDGEEHLGDEETDPKQQDKNQRKRSSGTASLTAAALKKARRNKAVMEQQHNASGVEKEEQEIRSRSMWDFVQRGTSGGTSSFGASATKRAGGSSHSNSSAKNVDALLEQLDSAPLTSRRRSTSASRRRNNSSSRRSSRGGARPQSRPRSTSASRSRRVSDAAGELPSRVTQDTYHQDDDDDGGMMPWDDGDDHQGYDEDESIRPTNNNTNDVEMKDSKEEKDAAGDANETKQGTPGKVRFADDLEETEPEKENQEQDTSKVNDDKMDVDQKEDEDEDEEAPKPMKRRLLARPKLGQKLSAPARKAKEQQEEMKAKELGQKKQLVAQEEMAKAVQSAAMSASFKPQEMASEASVPASAAEVANLESFVHTVDDKEDEQYLDFFWMDIAERGNGEILLFGKVAVPPKAGQKNNAKPKFVSCCVLVQNMVRNLFVLPRKNEDGEYANMADVHTEINSVLKGGVIPRVEGATWKGKVVKRSYAFGDSSIPREETAYLKVVYNGKYPSPAEEVCNHGGKHFQRILNAGASLLETFIVKRNLMGPCWLRIKNPEAIGGSLSWCKLEARVSNPKDVERLDKVDKDSSNRAAPPVTAVSIKLKTVVNPKTQKSEIIAVSAVCHKEVLLDTSSDESGRHMSHITLIRPLAKDGGGSGVPKFPRDFEREVASAMPDLCREFNERSLLSRLLTQLGNWDPDVLVAHNAWNFEAEVLLTRCKELKISTTWSKMGRRRRMQLPKTSFSSDYAINDAISGRLLCDTYIYAKELLPKETTYSLTNLAATQLKFQRQEIEPVDIPQWFESSKSIVELAKHTLLDAQLVHRLMFKLQILPLSKQLTCISGNLWSHTLKSKRAERNDYLLLHEFHQLKFIVPEKRRNNFKKKSKSEAARSKPKYSGGLVLEPKKGLYDSFILLLDFNSLYPSLMQEYNLCFTTIEWAPFASPSSSLEEKEDEDEVEMDESKKLPPLPDASIKQGVLPRVIKRLVQRRRTVKKLLKTEKNEDKRKELDIRQQALKLTANAMYGCLGYAASRFVAEPIAAMVTAMGRETLQRTVRIAEDSVGLDVIYGDTDSIMINTRLNLESDLPKVKALGESVKAEVNKLYRTLELEIDGVFRSMLLLKKKKYAARTVEEGPNNAISYGQELKGLDLVRRDWCIQSKDTGRFVVDQILSGEDTEVVVNNIHTHVEELAQKMRSGQLPLDKYTITKGLSKHPSDYPDAKSQAHVHVARDMIKHNRPVNKGDHIPYIITAPLEGDVDKSGKIRSAAERARHPDEILRSGGVLKPDIEYYLQTQILPPVQRLCEPIPETSASLLASKMGLDAAKYSQHIHFGDDDNDNDEVDFTPASLMPDSERFKGVEKFHFKCLSCNVESEFPGVFHIVKNKDGTTIMHGMNCVNPECTSPARWGNDNQFECFARLCNSLTIFVHSLEKKYYEGVIRCDEPMCGLETRQLSVHGGICLRRGCNGRMHSICTEKAIYTQLKYLETLFNMEHACEQNKGLGNEKELLKHISSEAKNSFGELHQRSNKYLTASSFNWISPAFWQFAAVAQAHQ